MLVVIILLLIVRFLLKSDKISSNKKLSNIFLADEKISIFVCSRAQLGFVIQSLRIWSLFGVQDAPNFYFIFSKVCVNEILTQYATTTKQKQC